MLDGVRARDLEPSGLNDDNGEHQTTDNHSRDHGRSRHVYFSLAASAASLRSSLVVSKLICSQMLFSGIADSRYAIVLYSVTTASAVASPPSRRRRRVAAVDPVILHHVV